MKTNILLVCCFLLVLLFVYTGASKLLDTDRFLSELNNQPIPRILIPYLAWVIPAIEIFFAVLLIADRTRLMGLAGSFVLMALFTGYTGLVLSRVFNRVPCSCGGVIRQLTWPQHLVFNLFFTGLALTGYLIQNQHRKNTGSA